MLGEKESQTVAKSFVENFDVRFEIPDQILTNQETEFLSSLFRESYKILEIESLNSTTYHH